MRLIDADALKGPIELQRASYARIGATERAEAYANCLWEIEQAPTIGGWISVKDRLPKEKDDVLILYERTGISGEKYREIDIESFRTMKHFGYVPLFWMPIPEPPKEADECNTD